MFSTQVSISPLVVVLDLLQPLLPVLGPHDNLWLLKMVPNDFYFSETWSLTPKPSLLHIQKQSYEIAHLSPRGDFTPKSENRNRPWTDLNIQFQMSPGVSWGRYTIGSIKKNVTPMKKSFLKNNLTP